MTTLHEAARLVVAAWTSTRRTWVEECNAAVMALDAALKAQAGCDTETDCTSQPWCRISGECHRKQEQPEPAQEPGTPATVANLARDIHAAVLRRRESGHEPAQEPMAWNWMLDGQPYGQAYYGNPPDADIAERAAIAGRTVRLLYTAPLRRPPLTDEEIAAEWRKASECAGKSEGAVTASQFVQIFARAVERKVRGETE